MLLVAAAVLGGCAQVWVDADGTRHMVGLLSVTLPAPASSAAELLRTRAVGLSWTRGDAGQALVLGFNDSTWGFVRNDACIRTGAGGLAALALPD